MKNCVLFFAAVLVACVEGNLKPYKVPPKIIEAHKTYIKKQLGESIVDQKALDKLKEKFYDAMNDLDFQFTDVAKNTVFNDSMCSSEYILKATTNVFCDSKALIDAAALSSKCSRAEQQDIINMGVTNYLSNFAIITENRFLKNLDGNEESISNNPKVRELVAAFKAVEAKMECFKSDPSAYRAYVLSDSPMTDVFGILYRLAEVSKY